MVVDALAFSLLRQGRGEEAVEVHVSGDGCSLEETLLDGVDTGRRATGSGLPVDGDPTRGACGDR